MKLIQKIVDRINQEDLWESEMVLHRNQYLKVMGSSDTNLYYVVHGSLRIYIINEFEEQTIRFGYQDNFIASLDSFISEKPSDYYIQALKKTHVKIIGKKTFMALMATSAENIQIWQDVLMNIIYEQLERERDILCTSPLERYKRVLARSPQLLQQIPNKYIACYLRMTPETLSRLKKS